MSKFIPNELALIRTTIYEADQLVEMLGDEESDQSQLLNQIQSILEAQQAGVDLLIELRNKLEVNGEFYNERAKAYRAYASQMARALSFVNESIINLHETGEIPNRLEGSAESLCIQNNPVKVECLVDTDDINLMEHLCLNYPQVFTKDITVTYSFDRDYVKANPDKPVVKEYFTFTQGKHIRVRRSTTPKSLSQS